MSNSVLMPVRPRVHALMNPALGAAIAIHAKVVTKVEIISGSTTRRARTWRPGASVRAMIHAISPPTSTDSMATVAASSMVLRRAAR